MSMGCYSMKSPLNQPLCFHALRDAMRGASLAEDGTVLLQ